MSHQSADLLNAAVSEEVVRLKALDFSTLEKLPASAERPARDQATTIAVIVWHDVLPSGEHRLVAQASRKTRLGFGAYLSADGFAISSNGDRRALSDEELSAFM
jgi:hypothetical protein